MEEKQAVSQSKKVKKARRLVSLPYKSATVTETSDVAHDDYIRNVIGASLLGRGNQKKCWSFVKLNRTENVGIPIVYYTNGLHITNQAKAECLNTQFVSVFTSDDGKHLPAKDCLPTVRWTPYSSHNPELKCYRTLTKRKLLAQMSYQQGY